MRILFAVLITAILSGCATLPTPLNSGGSAYSFHVADKYAGKKFRLFTTDINSDSVILVGRITANMSNCFIESGLPLVFYYGEGGLLALKSNSVIKQGSSNLYPFSSGRGIIAFHVPKEDLNKESITLKGYCSEQRVIHSDFGLIEQAINHDYGTYYPSEYIVYDIFPLQELVIKNENIPYKQGNIYYFGDMEYKINREYKDNPASCQVLDKQKEIYNELLKIMPEISKLPRDVKSVLPKNIGAN